MFYICRMRLFLSFILAAFFFVTPLQGNAAEKGTHRLTAAGSQLPKASVFGEIAGIDLAAVITPSVHSNGNAARVKSFSFTNYINTGSYPGNSVIAVDQKHFVPLYASHQPIALKLLFPEHYFW
jgi:hypothetical protein